MENFPIKNPPIAQDEAMEASIPSLVLEGTSSSLITSGSEVIPTLDPPSAINIEAEDSFSAGVWNNDKRVNALFSTNDERNAWMNVVGIGWVKLANNIDSANEALNVLATAAKVKNSPVNYLLEGGKVTQIYVW